MELTDSSEWRKQGVWAENHKWFALSCLLATAIFFIDIMLPLGVAGGVPYVAAVLLGWWFININQIVVIGAVSVVLTITGYVLSPEGGILWIVIVNRGLAVFVIAVSTFLVIVARKAAEARYQSELRFSQVLDNAVSGVITIDKQGTVRSFNRAAEDIFGYRAKEVIGNNVKLLMPEPFRIHHDGYITSYERTGEAKIIGIGREVEGLRKDGSVFAMDLAISELNAGGELLFTGTVTDISERKNAETALVAAKEDAERANQAKSEFLSSMSHELRTPLNAILGFTQLLNTDREHPLTEDQLTATELILQSGDLLMSLIDDVLDLAQIEAGKAAVNIETQNPTQIIGNCVLIVHQLAEQKGLTFYDRVAGWNLPELNVDATRFQQILLNLLSNAVKYNRPGGTVRLMVAEGKNGTIRFLVSDTGRGIAEEKHAQIFTPFSRLGLENSDITGSGIGLTITRELTEAMGGTIGFESALNLGSTFWVEFPIVSGTLSVKDNRKKPLTSKASITDLAASASFLQEKRTVLCVEDDPSSLKLLGSLIKRFPGTTMISAHTGELGIDLAEIHRPDVIMMDINLPGMDGLQALERLKESLVTKNIPVIALTARASTRDKDHGLKMGFDYYMTKPINVEEISEVLNQTLQEL